MGEQNNEGKGNTSTTQQEHPLDDPVAGRASGKHACDTNTRGSKAHGQKNSSRHPSWSSDGGGANPRVGGSSPWRRCELETEEGEAPTAVASTRSTRQPRARTAGGLGGHDASAGRAS